MIEKIRVSLWDIFSFFLTGMLAVSVSFVLGISFWGDSVQPLVSEILAVPAAVLIVLGALFFTMIGMLIEPLSNYSDSILIGRLFGWAGRAKEKHLSEERILKVHIAENYLGTLNGLISNPYGLCKEYVETKQLSTTFMVYLSRYGFYRNCSFIAFAVLPVLVIELDGVISKFAGSFVCLVLVALFKRRSADFYSLMAPAVYRAFLIDKNSWNPKY